MRILIDTNILISAALNSHGTPYKAYLKAVTYPNKGIICDRILKNYGESLIGNSRLRFPCWRNFLHIRCQSLK